MDHNPRAVVVPTEIVSMLSSVRQLAEKLETYFAGLDPNAQLTARGVRRQRKRKVMLSPSQKQKVYRVYQQWYDYRNLCEAGKKPSTKELVRNLNKALGVELSYPSYMRIVRQEKDRMLAEQGLNQED